MPFLCAVRSRPPVLHAVQPCCKHSHHPRYPVLAPVRGHCGSVCCRRHKIRRHLHRTAFAASDALAQPQAGHTQENAAGVRPSPGFAGFGSGSPGIPARTVATLPARQNRHSESVAPHRLRQGSVGQGTRLQRACCSASPSPPLRDGSVATEFARRPTPSLIRRGRTGGKSPRRACFDYRRRAGPFSLRRLGFTGVALRAPR